MNVWGLTGNIACGKSVVEGMLRDAGVPVVDLDVVAREVVEPGEAALDQIADAFGHAVIGDDGRLDRAALGEIVFADPDARHRLQAITWPAIYLRCGEHLAKLESAGAAVAVVSAALMVESGSYETYAGLIVVTCPPEIQLQRLLDRDELDMEGARARIDSQLPQADKAAVADIVVDNGGALESTRRQVEDLVERLRNRSGP